MIVLLVFCSMLFAVPTWAGHPMDPIGDTWTASPQGNGRTYYSNGLDSVEVTPSGPSSATYNSWTRDGQHTMGTIYTTPRYDQPRESLSEWYERTSPPAPPTGYLRERR